jgi:hypothetical protein
MPGDPTVARLTLLGYQTRPETHHRRVFLSSQPNFFHPLSLLHLMSPHMTLLV